MNMRRFRSSFWNVAAILVWKAQWNFSRPHITHNIFSCLLLLQSQKKTSTLRQRKGRAPALIISCDNVIPIMILYIMSGSGSGGSGVGGVWNNNNHHADDSIRPSRLRRARPYNSRYNKYGMSFLFRSRIKLFFCFKQWPAFWSIHLPLTHTGQVLRTESVLWVTSTFWHGTVIKILDQVKIIRWQPQTT